jgi:hypothetical protein
MVRMRDVLTLWAPDFSRTGFSLSGFEFMLHGQKSKEDRLKPVLLNFGFVLPFPAIHFVLRQIYLR